MAQKNITDEQIRDAAYNIWLEEGQPHGRDEAHWQQAVEALNAPKAKATRNPAAKKAAPKAKAEPKTKAAPKAKAKAAPKKTVK